MGRVAAGTAGPRFSPPEIEAMQETLSRYDGESLEQAVSGVPRTDFRFRKDARTSRGKLVEWTVDDDSVASSLMGSAKLTAAAMQTTVSSSGNCEILTSYPVSESLLPCEIPEVGYQR
ncbi:hypothetical protein HUO13_10055 [Saccharopolyspora erythraea]|uniref:hypothetical protein n=1 Tax=Saccharopolyspora erythraea TaxID=1836 RepID=UPI001BA5D899|nr:hypothetical protein [Saccharopolyspora erythraea]QUG99382.1 hypothetical protein HUO13_10055 [Saccharopolyspora erythraea]